MASIVGNARMGSFGMAQHVVQIAEREPLKEIMNAYNVLPTAYDVLINHHVFYVKMVLFSSVVFVRKHVLSMPYLQVEHA